MKAPALPPTRRYHNAAVYRSAELLIATSVMKPAWKRAPRPVIFCTGLICGAILVLLLLKNAREIGDRPIPSLAADETRASEPLDAQRPAPTPSALSAALPSLPSTPASVSPTYASPELGAASADTLSATPAPSLGSPTFAIAAPSPADANVQAQTAPLSWIAVVDSPKGLHLRGEITSFSGEVFQVAFQLHLVRRRADGGSVSGAVQFSKSGAEEEPIPLSGSWSPRSLMLRQELTVADRRRANPPDRHQFTLRLPDNSESDAITGTWTQGSVQRGMLSVKIIPAR